MEDSTQRQPAVRLKDITGWLVQSTAFRLFTAALLMLAAGRINWLWAWVYAALILAFDAAVAASALPRRLDPLTERPPEAERTKTWDRLIMPLAAGLLPLVTLVVAGLDRRFGWPPGMAVGVHVAGAALAALGYGLFAWAIAANPFFAPTARVQHGRDHAVATGGPYAVVRHPAYAGAILSALGIPLMLGSAWALIPAAAAAALFVARTALEDAALHRELPGYAAYARRTRHRLIPGIW
jgi:protein-S-isoprenylcysteine O-methyltransferase Ste14